MIFPQKPPTYDSSMSLGKFGELYAQWYLKKKKYKIIDTNYQARYGEIDLIFLDGPTLVFIEVKTRSSRLGGWPEEAVTPKKLSNLLPACYRYLQQEDFTGPWRLDVLAINVSSGLVTDLKHYINIT